MTRKQVDSFMVLVIASTWALMFGASHAWELVVAGAVMLACIGCIGCKR